jgi:hypothetical protein
MVTVSSGRAAVIERMEFEASNRRVLAEGGTGRRPRRADGHHQGVGGHLPDG